MACPPAFPDPPAGGWVLRQAPDLFTCTSPARLAYKGDSLKDAVHAILTTRLKKGDGGIIAVDRLGNITMQNNTSGLARAAADSSGYREVKLGNE